MSEEGGPVFAITRMMQQKLETAVEMETVEHKARLIQLPHGVWG
jgi:hypothetical protein